LSLLVAVCVLPLVAFGLGGAYLYYASARAEAEQHAMSTAHTLALLVQRDLEARLAALRVLAMSRTLQTDDVAGFRSQAEAFLAQQLPGANILLLRENGQQVMNTALPPDAPLPSRRDTTTLRRLFATATPSISDVFTGIVVRRPVVAMEVPVLRLDGSVAYGLTLNPTLDAFDELLNRQQLDQGWIVSILDRRGITVARNRDGAQSVGKPAAAGILPYLLTQTAGIVETTSREGIPAVVALSRVPGFDWSVGVGIPIADLTAPVWRAALAIGGIGLMGLALALGLAQIMTRRITRPISALRDLAATLDQDIPHAPIMTGLIETDEVALALGTASRERRAAEAALRESEERLRLAQESGNVGVWEWLPNSGDQSFSPVMERLYGLPPGTVRTYDDWRRRVHPDDIARIEAERDAALARREPFEVEFRAFHGSGDLHWMIARGRGFHGPDGRMIRVLGISLDVTPIRRAEQARQQAAELLHTIIETAPGLIYAKDREGRMVLANSQTLMLIGRPWAEVEGRTDLEYLSDATQAETVMTNDRRIMASGQTESLEEAVGQENGRVRIWLSTKTPMRDTEGEVTGVIGVSVEITERKRIEDRLRLMVAELNHRVKNTLATVQAIALQSLRGAASDVRRTFEARLRALAATHDVLTRESWEGASLHDVIEGVLAPYGGMADGRLQVAGPSLRLQPHSAVALSMGLHELTLNALKYGALSDAAGRVEIRWEITRETQAHLRLNWSERGGPPVVAPTTRGFGTRLIERGLAQDLNGTAQLIFAPEGVVCTIVAPLAEIAATAEVMPLPQVGTMREHQE
jgi:PAS domain S-box-containing protein